MPGHRPGHVRRPSDLPSGGRRSPVLPIGDAHHVSPRDLINVLRYREVVIGLAARGVAQLPRLLGRGSVHAAQRLVVWLPGPRRWHRRVARHPRAAQGALLRLARRRRVAPEVLEAVFVNERSSDKVRIAVVLRCEQFGGIAQVIPAVTQSWGPTAYAWPLTYAGDAVVVQHALRRCLRFKDREALRGGYARLANLAGPEVVWAMEHDHVGSLELMDPVVRRSMQSGDTDVFLEWLD